MATELLPVPEDILSEVVSVIRVGLHHSKHTSKEAREYLNKWCDEESEYLNRLQE